MTAIRLFCLVSGRRIGQREKALKQNILILPLKCVCVCIWEGCVRVGLPYFLTMTICRQLRFGEKSYVRRVLRHRNEKQINISKVVLPWRILTKYLVVPKFINWHNSTYGLTTSILRAMANIGCGLNIIPHRSTIVITSIWQLSPKLRERERNGTLQVQTLSHGYFRPSKYDTNMGFPLTCSVNRHFPQPRS